MVHDRRWSHVAVVALLVSAFGFGCAQELDDIDRTQPNKTRKSDLDGVWYMLQTVTDVPPTSAADFTGDTSKMEKIVWAVEENYLVAYRSYPIFPGADEVDGGSDYTADDYHESPVAIFPILSHFDVQREYDSSTGEQTNVITENTSDRPWFDREFMRVDWSQNQITNFDLLTEWWWYTPIELGFTIDEERDQPRSIYTERKGTELVYFDIPSKLVVEPDLWGCAFSWWGWGTDDCTAAEIEVVTSFAKTDKRRDYEPLPYDDQLMNRFGYFRSERYTFDQQRGVLESGISKMAERHNIWKETYRKDKGEFVRDAEGKLVPIPVEEREVRTIPWYLSPTYPDDELLEAAALETITVWDDSFRTAAALAQGKSLDEIPEMLVPCHNPVQEQDHAACKEDFGVGEGPRLGDLRYNFLWWIEAEQSAGLLGYGPAAADPETGEIISGRAHIYGGAVNTFASYGLDVLRFTVGELEPDELVYADHVREIVRGRTSEATNVDQIAPELRRTELGAWKRHERQRLEQREERRREPRNFDRTAVANRIKRAREAGIYSSKVTEELESFAASRVGNRLDDMTPEQRAEFDPVSVLNPTKLGELRRRQLRAMGRGLDFVDMMDPNVVGLARKYEERVKNGEHDEVWRELRAELFKSTAIHEVGHTLGLRHNFSGTYDSMNYFDEYWDLRRKSLFDESGAPKQVRTMADLYTLDALTQEQLDGRMREYQYSSIMDYGMKFNTDIHGIGRYDHAAIVFGYSAGSTATELAAGECAGAGLVWDSEAKTCLGNELGYVEVFEKRLDRLGDAGQILVSADEYGYPFDDPTTLTIPYLERYHYSTVMQGFESFDDAFDREWMRFGEFTRLRSADTPASETPVRVPYLFCTDDWVGALLSCNLWDAGADPFEATRNVVDDYDAYYYFRDFKRDRLGWDPWYAFSSYYYRIFLRTSDYFQNWYLSPFGADQVMDDYYWMAINMGFNLLVRAMATPEYGTYCTQPNGQLYHLSDQQGTSPEDTSEYILGAYCDQSRPFYEVPQGEGRRRFTRYDTSSGYNFGNYPQETGHVWTSMAAMLAMVDPEAFVVGAEGDIGTYSISFLDYFGEEAFSMVNAVLAEDYSVHSPVLEVTDASGQNPTGVLHYPILSPIWDAERSTTVDPATGIPVNRLLGPDRARTGVCEACTTNQDCNGYTGSYGTGGAYCVTQADGSRVCQLDCYDMDAGFCGDGFVCETTGWWCVPENGACDVNQVDCSSAYPHGSCPAGQTCDAGTCVDLWPVVETNTSLSQVDDIVFWGMLYSTFGWETRYNDQMNVFKIGTGETIDPSEGFELVTFTDPILGDTYGALKEDCDREIVEGGSLGLCASCDESEECIGYIGNYYGGVFCDALGGKNVCLLDCTQEPDSCPDGFSCEAPEPGADAYCVPDHARGEPASCTGWDRACSPTNTMGTCPEGETCHNGACMPPSGPSSRCRLGWSTMPGGAQLILRGQELTRLHDEALLEWAEYSGNDVEYEDDLYRRYSKNKWAIEWLLMELNTIRAVYDWLGKVY